MTRPVQKPTMDYSLHYQVMLDTLNSENPSGVTSLQLEVSPPGVTAMNRPLLLSTAPSPSRVASIMKPRYQRRRRRRSSEPEVTDEARRKKVVATATTAAAILQKETSRLLLRQVLAGGGEGVVPGVGVGRLRAAARDKVAGRLGLGRSKNEPMHFPPITDGGGGGGGGGGSGGPSLGHRPLDGVLTMKHFRQQQQRKQQRKRSSSGADDDAHALPDLSRANDEKNRFMDSSFLRGVKRHTTRANANIVTATARTARLPWSSWDEDVDADVCMRVALRVADECVDLKDLNKSIAQVRNPQLSFQQSHTGMDKKSDVQFRLHEMELDLDLNMDVNLDFSEQKKIETIRQWRHEQYQKHLEKWRPVNTSTGAGTGTGDAPMWRNTHALELLAKYKQQETKIATVTEILNTQQQQKQQRLAAAGVGVPNRGSAQKVAAQAAPEQTFGASASNVDMETATCPKRKEQLQEGSTCLWERIAAGEATQAKTAQTDPDSQPDLVDMGEEYCHANAMEYIANNNLLSPDKCRRIQDWLNSVDLTSDYSLTSSSHSVTSNCSDDLLENASSSKEPETGLN